MTRVVGLMSGTSADGIVAALVRMRSAGGRTVPELETLASIPFPRALRERILAVGAGKKVPAEEIARLDATLGDLFAAAAIRVAKSRRIPLTRVAAIGSHGQTIFHGPHGRPPATMQIGDPSRIAERTGVTVVADFRRRDVAAGGEGAPLVPLAHAALFGGPDARAIQNLGGIANVTVLPARRGRGDRGVFAFDTGPGNMILDGLMKLATRGRIAFDRNGRRAARGTPDERLLASLLRDPFFRHPPPRSTGRERYGTWAARLAASKLPLEDRLATASELTARSIALAYRDFVLPRVRVSECLLCGGGAFNRDLVERIRKNLQPLGVPVGTTDETGVPALAVEAMAFALLAWETLHGRAGNVAAATGARGARVLGVIAPGAMKGS